MMVLAVVVSFRSESAAWVVRAAASPCIFFFRAWAAGLPGLSRRYPGETARWSVLCSKATETWCFFRALEEDVEEEKKKKHENWLAVVRRWVSATRL